MADTNNTQSNVPSDMNKPMVISVLYLASIVTGITGLVAFVLAFVWKGGSSGWEASHYDYHIRTGIIGLILTAVCIVLFISIIGWLILWLVAPLGGVWLLVRSVIALMKALEKQPMPNPDSWTI